MRKMSKIITSLIMTIALTVLLVVPVFAGTKHTVTFKYNVKTVQYTVEHGCSVLPPTDTYYPGYIFLGWTGDATNVTEDRIILGAYSKVDAIPATAQPQKDDKTYIVKFVDGLTDGVYFTQEVMAGKDANPVDVPYHTGWHFARYEGNYQCVDSDRTITAIYEEDWNWVDSPEEHWWLYYSTDDPDNYQNNWWM